jgi:hypothetical protein
MKDPVFAAVAAERERQDKKWGEQNHRDGTDSTWEHGAALAKELCDQLARRGKVTWRHILHEEVLEVFAETDQELLKTELVQVMAVCKAWIECIDRRAARVLADTPSDT